MGALFFMKYQNPLKNQESPDPWSEQFDLTPEQSKIADLTLNQWALINKTTALENELKKQKYKPFKVHKRHR